MTTERQKKQFSIAELFGLNIPRSIQVEGYSEPGPFTPPLDELHVFRQDILSDLLGWMKIGGGEPLYIWGPTGCGKSSEVVQTFARLNMEVQQVNAHPRMEVDDLLGQTKIIGDSTVFVDGPLTTAARHGHYFVMEEGNLLDPGTLAGLNTPLEGGRITLTQNGGEVVDLHPDFGFVLTANNAGQGDKNGFFRGTMPQNLATLDRFWPIKVGYPEPALEKEVLLRAVSAMEKELGGGALPEAVLDTMIKIANTVRRCFMGAEDDDVVGDTGRREGGGADVPQPTLEITMSTRALVRWARQTMFFAPKAKQGINPIMYALDRAVGFRAEAGEREAIREIASYFLEDEQQAGA